jgi:hypothetical protein
MDMQGPCRIHLGLAHQNRREIGGDGGKDPPAANPIVLASDTGPTAVFAFQGPFLTQRESLVRLIARAAQADCGRDTAWNRLAVGSYEWDAYERTSFGPQLSIRCRWPGLVFAHHRHLLRLTEWPP